MSTWVLVAFLMLVPGTGLTLTARRARRQFAAEPGTFRCRVRVCGTPGRLWPRLRQRWSRPLYARWMRDVLVVRRGAVLVREIRLPARVSGAGVYQVPREDMARWARRTVAVHLLASDGSRLDVAASEDDRMELVGPFLTAAIRGLPPVRVRRRPIT